MRPAGIRSDDDHQYKRQRATLQKFTFVRPFRINNLFIENLFRKDSCVQEKVQDTGGLIG